jgi:hypothetical protein
MPEKGNVHESAALADRRRAQDLERAESARRNSGNPVTTHMPGGYSGNTTGKK